MAGHGGVSATGTEEPFSIGAGVHQFKVSTVYAIGAADGMDAVGSDTFHFGYESMTFLVDGKTVVAGHGGFAGERLGTDGATREFGVNGHRSNGLRQQTTF